MDLATIAKEGESQEVEFKQILELDTDGKKREFAKDISAMANSVEKEGLILIGVAKDGTIIGTLKDHRLIERAQQVNSSRCSPPVKFSSEWIRYDGKNILALHFPKTGRVPHSIDRTEVYIRREIVVEKATSKEIYELERRSREYSEPETESEPDISMPLYTVENYNPFFYPLSGPPLAYRTIQIQEPYAGPAVCPVFMPHFGLHVPEPEIGDTRSAILFEDEPPSNWYSRELLQTFLYTLEGRVQELSDRAGAWRVHPMSWGISGESQYTYGLSASNAISAIENVTHGLFAAVFQFERVNVYKPTNWLALLCEIRNSDEGKFYVRNCGMKLYLSSIPISKDWVDYLFDSTRVLTGKPRFRNIGEDAIMESMHILNWEPKEDETITAKVTGMLGRDKVVSEPDYDDGLGIAVKPEAFGKIKLELDEESSWHADSYKRVFDKMPTECFDEVVMEITNPVPHWMDLKKGSVKIRVPKIKMAILGIAGHLVIPINIRAFSSWK